MQKRVWSGLLGLGLAVSVGCRNDGASDLDSDPVADRCAWAPEQTWDASSARADRIAGFFADAREASGAEGVAWAVLIDGEVRFAGADGMADTDRPMPRGYRTPRR